MNNNNTFNDEATTGAIDANVKPTTSTTSGGGSSTCCKCVFWMFTLWTRLVALAFCGFAFWACWDIQNLIVGDDAIMDSFVVEGDTLKVPLVLCLPNALIIDGVAYAINDSGSNDNDNNDFQQANCRSLDYMIYAVAISLLLSGIAVVLFLLVDAVGRCTGHVSRNRNLGTTGQSSHRRMASCTVGGMGLLLLFLLVQTGITTGALVEQLDKWVEYVDDILQSAPTRIMDDNNMTDTNNTTDIDNTDIPNPAAAIDHVEPLANLWILLSAAALSFGAAFWILVDALIVYPCRPTSGVEDDYHDHNAQVNSIMESQRLAVDTTASNGSQAYSTPKGFGTPDTTSGSVTSFGQPTPSWTN